MSCVSLNYTMWWFDTWIYCEIITVKRLVNTCISSQSCHLFVFLPGEIYCLSSFQIYDTVNSLLLLIIAMPYIIFPECIHLLTGIWNPLINISPFLPPPTPDKDMKAGRRILHLWAFVPDNRKRKRQVFWKQQSLTLHTTQERKVAVRNQTEIDQKQEFLLKNNWFAMLC